MGTDGPSDARELLADCIENYTMLKLQHPKLCTIAKSQDTNDKSSSREIEIPTIKDLADVFLSAK